MNAREYMNQARILETRINKELERVRELEEITSRCTSGTSDMPGSPNRDNQSKEKMMVKLIDLKYKVNELIDDLVDLKEEINEKIFNLSKSEYMKVLYLRYIKAMSWEEIAVEMHVSCSYVFKLHKKALCDMDRLMSEDDE